jgi:hypothetical protein
MRTYCTVVLFREMEVPRFSLIAEVAIADLHGSTVWQLLCLTFLNCPPELIPYFVFVKEIDVI